MLRTLFHRRHGAARPTRAGRPQPRRGFRPRLEALEDVPPALRRAGTTVANDAAAH